MKLSRKATNEIKKKKRFLKTFYIMSFGVLIFACIIFAVNYYTVKENITNQTVDDAMEDFRDIRDSIEEAEMVANSIATQLLLDPSSSGVLWAISDDALKFSNITRVSQQMKLFKAVNDNIQSIYLYNGQMEFFVSTDLEYSHSTKEDFSDRGIVEIIDNYENYANKKFVCRNIVSSDEGTYAKEEKVYTIILDYFKGNEVCNAVIVNMSMSQLYEKLLHMNGMQDSYIVVYDEWDDIILEMNTLDEDDDVMRMQSAFIIDEEEGYRESRVNGEKYFMSHLTSEKNGWDFVKITKWSTVFELQNEIKKAFLILTILILTVILSISIASLLYIYYMDTKLEREYSRKIEIAKGGRRAIQDEFFTDFINSRIHVEETELKRQLEESGFPKDRWYTLAELKVNHSEKLVEQFGESGAYDILYGFRNIFEEISSEFFVTHGIVNRDFTILFIVSDERNGLQAELKQIFSSFCEKEKIFLEWDFQMLTIDECVSPGKLPELREKIRREREGLFFYAYGSVVKYEKLGEENKRRLDYSKLDQNAVGKALYGGKWTEVSAAYENFKEKLQDCNATDYKNALIFLAFLVARIVDEYGEYDSCQPGEGYQSTGTRYLRELVCCDTIYRADELVESFLREALMVREKEVSRTNVYQKMEDIKAYIRREFKNPNLSQELVAGKFGFSSQYLGRQFKKYTGESLAGYVNNVRLEVILEQMKESNRSIKDIAADNGFESPNYFYAYFKKKIGVSPQVYREKNYNSQSS